MTARGEMNSPMETQRAPYAELGRGFFAHVRNNDIMMS